MKKIKKIYIMYTYIFNFVYKSLKHKLFILILINMLLGAVIPINLYLSKQFINAITKVVENNANPSIACCYLICIVIMYLIAEIIRILNQNILEYSREKIIYNTKETVLKKCENLNISFFEKSNMQKQINFVRNETPQQIISFLEFLLSCTNILISSIGILNFSTTLNSTFVFFIAVIFAVPYYLINKNIVKNSFNVACQNNEENRKIEYLENLFFDPRNIAELKIFKMQTALSEIILRHFKTTHTKNDCLRKKTGCRLFFCLQLEWF